MGKQVVGTAEPLYLRARLAAVKTSSSSDDAPTPRAVKADAWLTPGRCPVEQVVGQEELVHALFRSLTPYQLGKVRLVCKLWSQVGAQCLEVLTVHGDRYWELDSRLRVFQSVRTAVLQDKTPEDGSPARAPLCDDIAPLEGAACLRRLACKFAVRRTHLETIARFTTLRQLWIDRLAPPMVDGQADWGQLLAPLAAAQKLRALRLPLFVPAHGSWAPALQALSKLPRLQNLGLQLLLRPDESANNAAGIVPACEPLRESDCAWMCRLKSLRLRVARYALAEQGASVRSLLRAVGHMRPGSSLSVHVDRCVMYTDDCPDASRALVAALLLPSPRGVLDNPTCLRELHINATLPWDNIPNPRGAPAFSEDASASPWSLSVALRYAGGLRTLCLSVDALPEAVDWSPLVQLTRLELRRTANPLAGAPGGAHAGSLAGLISLQHLHLDSVSASHLPACLKEAVFVGDCSSAAAPLSRLPRGLTALALHAPGDALPSAEGCGMLTDVAIGLSSFSAQLPRLLGEVLQSRFLRHLFVGAMEDFDCLSTRLGDELLRAVAAAPATELTFLKLYHLDLSVHEAFQLVRPLAALRSLQVTQPPGAAAYASRRRATNEAHPKHGLLFQVNQFLSTLEGAGPGRLHDEGIPESLLHVLPAWCIAANRIGDRAQHGHIHWDS